MTGVGVNSGAPVTLTLKPARPDHGVIFKRTDIPGSPEIKAHVSAATDLVRMTVLASGAAKVVLVEHVMSALAGVGVDNVVVEMSAAEAPIMDGSARPFVELLRAAGVSPQEAECEFLVVDSPLFVTRGRSTIVVLPSPDLKITCTTLDDRALEYSQHLSLTMDPDVYCREIAGARTYVLYDDAQAMKAAGGIRGGSLDNCIVLRGAEVMVNEPLRFPDELVRHKILDIVGDVSLVGCPVRAHFIAIQPGHAINAELSKALIEKGRRTKILPR